MQKQLLLMLAVTVSGMVFHSSLQAQSCPGIASVSFNVLAPPVPTISGTTQICTGGSTTLTVPGAFESYNWGGAGSGSGQSISATAPGTYVVTVTNAAGCTGTTSVAVTQLPAPVPNIAQATYQCNGQRVLNAGAGFASYAWSAPGGSSPTLTVTSPGLYMVTVTNAAGCTGTDDINVTIPAPPFVAVAGPSTFCQGGSTALGATAGLSSYSWTGGGSGNTFIVTSPGTYTVTATDAFGCTVTSSATVTELPAPAPTITGVVSFCAGSSTTLDAGGGFNSYSWSGGNGSNQTATVSTSGTYTVTVTAANGCTGTDSQVVNVTAAPVPNIVTTPYACNGQVTMNAGSGFSSYAWSAPGGSSQNLTVSNPGTYVVTVTNALGCSGTDNFVVTIPAPPAVNIGGATSFCQGSSTVLSATPGLNAYSWTGGGSGANLTVTAAGTYTVTATDGFGCTTTSSATVGTLPAPTPTVNGTNVICSGGTTTFSVPGSFSSYQWSGGNGTSSSITVGNAGTYTVTVTAANGCTGTASRTLTLNASPSPAIAELAYQCNGQVTLSVGNGFSTYNWSTSQSSPTISVNQTNTYSVTVSSAAGCTGTATYFLVVPDQPVVNIAGNNQICPGATTVLSATPGFGTYQWSSTPVTSANITVGSAGVYTVTVTDGFGCTTTNQFTVNALAAPAPNISGPSAICPGSTATFSVPGTFTNYQWSTLANGPSISTTTAGTYTVTVTAANGCTGTDSQTLALSNTLQPQVVAQPYLCNGQFTLDAGTGFATYNWSTTGTGQTITVSTSGTYLVTVTESGGCTGTASFNVNIPPPPVASVSGAATVCPGSTVVLNAPAGFAGYTWSNGFLTSSVSVSLPDDYTVTVTDAAGCTATATATVGNFSPPVASISGPSTICTNSSATFSVPAGFSTYLWSTGLATASITVDTAATYAVTVTDANGCTAAASQDLLVLNALQPQIAAQPYACNGQISLDAGTGFSSYLWSNGDTTAVATALQTNNYTVTVTGTGGCTGTASVAITVPVLPVAAVTGGGNVCPGAASTLTATAGFAAYQWSTADNTASIAVTNPNTYTVTVTDTNGCTTTASGTVGNFAQPAVSIAGNAEICAGSTTTLTASNGFASYQWSNGSATASITVDSVSNYVVTVTDGNGCTTSSALATQAVTALSPAIALQPYQCTGSLTLDAGAGFNTYLWSGGGAATQTLTISTSGTYTVTVSNSTGCTGTTELAVTVPLLPVAAVTGGGNVCPGAAATLTATAGFAAYQWSTLDNTASISSSTPATYTVTVTDADGCTTTATGTVGNFAQPVVSITGNAQICAGSTTTLTASSGFASYQWSNGSATASITVDSVSNYVVTVTDANGCTTSSALATQAVAVLSPAIALQPYQCNGALTLDAGAGFSTYSWSGGGAATQTLTVSTSGTYTVTVSNSTGCTGTTELAVTVPVLPVAAVTGGGNVCPGAASTLTATAGFAAYQWSTADNTASIAVTNPNTYTVTVTDTNGCTTTASGTVGNFAQPAVSIAGNVEICAGSTTILTASSGFASYQWSNGSATASITVDSVSNYAVTVTDGNGCTTSSALATQAVTALSPAIALQPYQCTGSLTLDAGAGFNTYLWSGGGAATQTLTVSTSGTYTVTVSNSTGCTGTTELAVTVPVLPVAAVTGGGNVCPGAASTLTATAGFAAYQWSTLDNTASISTSTPATYTVTVTDADGCTTTATGTVGNFAQPAVSITGNAQICAGSTTTLTASSGFASYQWSNGPATASITVDSVSNYVVTVTDANGCTTSSALATQAVAVLSPAIALQPYQCDGALTLDAGAGFSTYSWSGGGAATQTLTVSTSGTYTVTVSNSTGCTGTTELAVTVPVLPVAAVTGGGNVCPGAAATLTATAGFATYLWSNTQSTASITTSTPASYTVTVTDADGCTATATATVGNFVQPTVSITGTAQICAGNSTTLSATSGFASYQWSNNQSTASIVVATAGNYSTTVTDGNGCTATATRTVVVGALPVLTAAVTSDFGGFATPCGGSALGTASATVTGGTAPFGYAWSGGAGNSAQVSNLAAGTYLLTVTDALGCTGTASVTLNSAPPLAPTLEVVAPTCDEPGQVTVLFAQTPANATTIALDNGAPELLATNFFTFNELESGSYTVRLADNFGCTTELTAAVPPGPQLLEQVGDTLEVARGTVLTLPVALSFNPANIVWTPATDLSCSDCLTPEVTVNGTLLLQLTATGLGDCVAEGTYLLKVKAQSGVYAPNALAPGSGANGAFTLFGDEFLVQIRRLQVYDRWGNQVAALTNFQPNDPSLGWDGRFREQVVNPGVYVWWAELEYADGTTKIVDGDVTVVR